MVLLPSNQAEFSSPSYWKKFFEKSGSSAFEWYGEYTQLDPILSRYIKSTDKILQIGCGNSILADQLYDNGFRNITSLDTDEKVIQKQEAKNKTPRPELIFKHASATETGFEDESVNVVIDKGTLDALLPLDADEEVEKVVSQMFEEISRVLIPLGKYVVVTLAQDHIVHKFLETFHKSGRFLAHIHRVETDKSFAMPVFVFVATKLRVPMTTPIHFMNAASVWEKLGDEKELAINLRGEREFAWLFHQTAGCLGEEVTFTLSDQFGQPRYVFTILDDPALTTLLTYGVFIVPVGHETDWLFTTAKGRATLRKQCGRHRLLLVQLMKNQLYLSINHIELEITDLSRRIAPPYFNNKAIEFLSLGRMESLEKIAEGESPVNGKWTVEHVKGNDTTIFRRLIFLNSSSLIQSEVEVYKTPKGKLKFLDDYLSCDHHRSQLVALQFLAGDLESAIAKASEYRFCVLGLGGGLLAKFLHQKLPGCEVVGVEYDKVVVKIARGHFGLPTDERIKIIVDDAYNVLKNYSTKEDKEKFDIIFMDLASSESEESGLACPPAKFVTPEALELAHKCLRPNGIFTVNIVTRDEQLLDKVKDATVNVFPNTFTLTYDEDVNVVAVCPLNYKKQWLKNAPKKQTERWEVSYAKTLEKLIPVNKHTKTVQRIRYKPNYQPPFECPHKSDHEVPKQRTTYINENVQQRILLIKDSSSTVHVRILDFLNHFKLPIRTETLNRDSNLLLQLGSVGRFSLVIFSNYAIYERLSTKTRQILHDYAQSFNVGIIHFVSSNECQEVLCRSRQQAVRLKFKSDSLIPFVARTNVAIEVDNLDLPDWNVLWGNDKWTSVLEAEDENGDVGSVVLHKKDPFEQVLIGHDLNTWPIHLAFFDTINYFLGDKVTGGLTRYLQIDIDDVFVAQAGTRLVKDDISTLFKTQQEVRQFVSDFWFTLGFSGYYFKHGNADESEGDEQLILDAANFLWFPHTWKHNHVHEYSTFNLSIIMQQNKQFATENNLNVSLEYAVSPQHSGVYPIHNGLYDSWKDVWGVKVTSTEEYPHFAPASKRRAFTYKNISVLPRQTCGLYTHTLYFHAMPDGFKSHQNSIFGGALFNSVLLNQFSIFMTHQQNFGNDRLGAYTFLNLFRFLKCYTNLQLKWIPPVQLAKKYLERFGDEKQLFYTDVCADIRHVRTLPLNQTCKDQPRLPNTLIVGPQKTGTTALREFLLLHPNVSSNKDVGPGYFEEAQFFAGNNYEKGLEWYRQLFEGKNGSVLFEKSANYFDNPRAVEAIYHLIPNVKIIIILINPAERAHSWYQHMRAHSDPNALKYTPEELFSDKIDTPEARKLRNRCLQPGFYARHLERWLDFFAPNQLVIIDGLELKEEPPELMNRLISTLNLPRSVNYEQLLKFDSQKGFFCANNGKQSRCLGKSKGRRYEPMSAELRSLLAKHFEEPNKALVNLLNHYEVTLPSFLKT
ncbi:[Heparan sulfate]-glucosamine N-sulfotransferase [Aphelenchoides bicaudatus]|nr:[Heparan sulfate]-glucosamine N-sulfotransferase [Aphelenchoides bicaudatus]